MLLYLVNQSDMKKHRFRVGDVVYCLTDSGSIQEFIYLEQKSGSPHVRVCEKKDTSYMGLWYFKPKDCHPTPEACAQALVDEFYLNNPKT